jgi:hypothetical protein
MIEPPPPQENLDHEDRAWMCQGAARARAASARAFDPLGRDRRDDPDAGARVQWDLLSDVGSRRSPHPASGEDVMATQRRWSDLSERTRKLIIVTAVAESILKGVALIDIKRRPADQIRGPKWLWAPVVAVVNSAGVVPIAYFVFGRRRPPSAADRAAR